MKAEEAKTLPENELKKDLQRVLINHDLRQQDYLKSQTGIILNDLIAHGKIVNEEINERIKSHLEWRNVLINTTNEL